jgi:hypothetical protein
MLGHGDGKGTVARVRARRERREISSMDLCVGELACSSMADVRADLAAANALLKST